ncbi:CLUMA_CG000881, isoform A [Clunio marinus]|uniref:CLUMA_CG000881, isoform A n=1 Tax=Clunio marinus TaxID=568069 RepID=A0A1J1HHI5_9DIPT|nr:CLUMA_CG000881, isoform A [Clunio marinus]
MKQWQGKAVDQPQNQINKCQQRGTNRHIFPLIQREKKKVSSAVKKSFEILPANHSLLKS